MGSQPITPSYLWVDWFKLINKNRPTYTRVKALDLWSCFLENIEYWKWNISHKWLFLYTCQTNRFCRVVTNILHYCGLSFRNTFKTVSFAICSGTWLCQWYWQTNSFILLDMKSNAVPIVVFHFRMSHAYKRVTMSCYLLQVMLIRRLWC